MAWIQVSPQALRGEGLVPYAEGEIRNLFDWAENPGGMSAHFMAHRGRFLVDIVSIEANAVHQPSKPGDEIVVVLNGTLRLTTDGDGHEQSFGAGETVLIPGGWAGLYRVEPDSDGPFLELAIVPHDYFDPSLEMQPSGLAPRRLDWPSTAGVHELHRNRYAVVGTNIAEARRWPIEAASDIVIRILAGTLNLTSDGKEAAFEPGGVVILPPGFTGSAAASAGYRALTASWLG